MKNAKKINSSWFFALAVVAFFVPYNSAVAKKRVSEDTKETTLPAAFVRKVDGAQRFQDPAYFSLMAGGGIQSKDAKALFARLQAAVASNERYKALYLARIFTAIKPDVAAGWSNRASLASALGLSDEASACQTNADNVQHLTSAPPTVLPGAALTIKPVSLADWAAAVALLSDDTAAKEGRNSLVAVKDTVSGIHKATDEEVQERDRDNKENGLTPSGPWANPEPIRLQHVLPNVFALGPEEPMHFKSLSTGSMFGAMLMAGMAGMQQSYNPGLATQAQEMSQEMAGRASQVPSHYKGGSYTEIIYTAGKEVSKVDHPQSSGEFETVGLPVPLLWASGGVREPLYAGSWKGTEKARGRHFTSADLEKNPDARPKLENVPEDLRFPKLMSLCVQTSCSHPLSLTELILTTEDLSALAPEFVSNFDNNSSFRQAYQIDQLIIDPNNGGHKMVGIAKDGSVYEVYTKPTVWLQAGR